MLFFFLQLWNCLVHGNFDTSDLISVIIDWLPASQSRLNHKQFPNNRLRTLNFIQISY